MSQIQGEVIFSVQQVRANGSPNVLQLQLGELAFSEVLPRFTALGWSGLIYSCANQAAQAVSVALATTYTGIGVYNPVGSGVNLVMLKAKFALSVAPAAIATIGLLSAFSATGAVTAATTPLTTRSGIIGNTRTAIGLGFSAATITTPIWTEQFVDGFTAAALPAPSAPQYLDGMLLVAPGGFIGIGALTAVTGLGSLFWAELPV